MDARIELERSVLSVHNNMSPTLAIVKGWDKIEMDIKTMSDVLLLRFCHPAYRADFAKRLYEEGRITRKESSEYNKFN